MLKYVPWSKTKQKGNTFQIPVIQIVITQIPTYTHQKKEKEKKKQKIEKVSDTRQNRIKNKNIFLVLAWEEM